MADSDSPGPPSLKAVIALLREARSLSRHADKPGRSVAAAVDDPTTQQFAAGACSSVEQLVSHLTVLERQVRQREKAAAREKAALRRER
jgi:hypothetical protein